MCPVIALWSLTDTDGGIIKTMFMMTVSSSVATTRRECFVFILEVPALPRLVALVVHQLVAVVLVFLAHLHSPGLVDPGMLLTKPASHGVSLSYVLSQSEMSIVLSQPIRDEYSFVSTNQR